MSEPHHGTWVLAARGDLGAEVHWQKGFEVLGNVRSLLNLLEEVGEHRIDWAHLLAGLPYFAPLRSLPSPPLYDESRFEELDGFLTLVDEPEHDQIPGMSFNQIRVYVEREQRARILGEFEELERRLKSYELLKP